MDAYEARELAFAILMEFEEILDEYDVTIPSPLAHRGRPQSTRQCEAGWSEVDPVFAWGGWRIVYRGGGVAGRLL
jgi:hypothetical protein